MDVVVTMNNRHQTMSPAAAVTKSIIIRHPNFLLSLLPYSPSPIFSPKKSPSRLQTLAPSSSVTSTNHRRRRETLILLSKSSSSSAELSPVDEEWLRKLPEKKKPLYSHSLPCIEAWLKKLGFRQSTDDRALWLAENSEWHAQLSLDITDLHIRYLKSGPGDLEKDVERRFSYALSREDIENAILGGP